MKRSLPLALLMIFVATLTAATQEAGSSVVVIKCSWNKERIRPRPSVTSLASQDELIQKSRLEQDLADAKRAGDRGKVNRTEAQMSRRQKATTEAQQTELPRDGYKYKVTLRNDGEKTIKSIDWDYLFIDPSTQQELARHQFSSDETIKPGKRKELEVLYLTPPIKTVSARMLDRKVPLSPVQQVIVARIQYSDGSVWQHP